jgi:hypothetical protein
MKKISSLILAVMTAFGFAGWGALSEHATTAYTAQQVAQHNTAADCWLIISGQVYDVTNFIPIHPGGNAIVPYCGTDATTIFDSIHGTTGTAASLLPPYLIGVLATALVAPSNVAGTPTQTTVALNWTASTGGVAPITYTVLKNGIANGTTTATTFTSTGLTASTSYTYAIIAADSATPTANTATSSQISVTTLATSSTGGGGSTSTLLIAPANVAGTPTQTSVALSWTASTGGVAPITYTILKNGISVGTTSATTFTNTGLTASTTYAYVIRASDSAVPAGIASSSQVSVTTLAASSTGGGEQENENEMENETENEHISTSTPSTGNGHGDDGNVGTGTSHHENEGGSHGSGHGRDD